METTSATVTSAEALPSTSASSALSRWTFAVSQRHRYLLDKLVPHVLRRWITFLAIAFAYSLRVYLVEGFYIVTYALGLYMMTLLIGFLSPRVDPELQELMDGPTLPIRGSDEFRPFVRRLPEFKFWLCLMYGFLFGFLLTFFPMFDVPVFWPILLFYWIAFFTVSMRRQIAHMMKYKYVPFTFGKQTYGKKKSSSANTTANLPKD